MKYPTVPFLFLAITLACTEPGPPAVEFEGRPGSAAPNLVEDRQGGLILTWLERDSAGRSSLQFAVREKGEWSTPGVIVQDRELFVNWADFPSLTVTGEGAWVAHFLEKTATSPYAYHAMVTSSRDAGATWTTPEPVHDDRSDTEHGFVAMVTDGEGGVDLTWLDGRAMTEAERGPMSVRTRYIDRSGTFGPERLLDDRSCECCQTAVTRTSRGLLAAYRDRSEDEIRDIAIVREEGDGWTDPLIVAADAWEHRACPVNGPALASEGESVWLAWYTGVGSTPRVYLVHSTDAGLTWGERLQIDGGSTLGRVDLQLVPETNGAVIIAWLDADAETEGGAVWRLRRIGADEVPGPTMDVAHVNRARVSGFPRLAFAGGALFMATTATDLEGSRSVQVHRIGLPIP
jgi:hypothetical protein